LGRLAYTKYILRNTPERITITRRHHPLQSQQFDVAIGGRKRITIRLDDGTTMRIPRGWTDADGGRPQDERQRDGVLTIDSLRRLFDLIDALASRSTDGMK